MNHNEVIQYLIVSYPDSNFPLPTQKLYIQELSDVPADELFRAARYHVNRSPYPKIPTIGELRIALNDIRRRQAALPDAFAAWGEVVREFSRFRPWRQVLCEAGVELAESASRYKDNEVDYWRAIFAYREHLETCQECINERPLYQFSHPLIQRALEAVAIQEINVDNEGVQRAHFVKAYEQLMKRAADETLPMLES